MKPMSSKICQNKTCKKRFLVRTKKIGTRYANAHRKYCLDCDGVKVWESLNQERGAFLRRRWAKLNPKRAKARYRRHRLKKKYGLTVATFNEKKRKQRNRCAACQRVFGKVAGPPNVDHKHGREGTCRDLLCVNCNFIVGHSQEDTRILYAIIKYIKKWED